MQLLDSWKRSLEFFERKNVSIFGLVTLKAIKTTYGQIFKYLLVPIFFVLSVDLMILYDKFPFVQSRPLQLIFWALRIVFLIFIYLSARSSVLKKDWFYYRSYWKHGIYLLVLLGLVFVLLSQIGYWWWASLSCFITFTVFFFFDSQ